MWKLFMVPNNSRQSKRHLKNQKAEMKKGQSQKGSFICNLKGKYQEIFIFGYLNSSVGRKYADSIIGRHGKRLCRNYFATS